MSAISRLCGSCQRELPPLKAKICGRCHLVLYCGRECQGNHWPVHKAVCRATHDLSVAQKTSKIAADSQLTPSATKQVEEPPAEAQVFAEQVDLNAQNVIADQQAFLLLLKAAEQGDREAQREVGLAYYNGKGVLEDSSKGFQWLLKAAKQGDREAQREVGLSYYHGDGIFEDFSKSFRWLLKAAKQGCTKSQYDIAECYENGEGILKNDEKALRWYLRAAKGGNVDACKRLMGMYQDRMFGVPENKKWAFAWLLKAAKGGGLEAQEEIADIYYSAENYQEALPWLIKAASQNSSYAFKMLGDMHRDGIGVPQDIPQALEYYRRAGKLGTFRVVL